MRLFIPQNKPKVFEHRVVVVDTTSHVLFCVVMSDNILQLSVSATFCIQQAPKKLPIWAEPTPLAQYKEN